MALDLEAIELIKQLKHKYFRSIDTADLTGIAECFTDDASIHYIGGTYEISQQGRDDIVAYLEGAFNPNAVGMHTGHHPEISVQLGDTEATGKWYLHDIFYELSAKIYTTGTAIYDDRYVKTDQGWKIAHSGYERIWEMVEQLEAVPHFTKRLLAEKLAS